MTDSKFRGLLAHLQRGGAFGFFWTAKDKKSFWWKSDAPGALPQVQDNIYFGVHPATQRGGTFERSKRATIAAVNCLFAEFDAKDFADKATALEHIQNIAPAPSVIIDSGGGYHCYWLLESPFLIQSEADRAHADRLQKQWVKFTGGDDGAKDLARVLRVPGTANYKYDPPRPVEFLFSDCSKLYDLAALETASPPDESPAPLANVPNVAPAIVSGDEISRARAALNRLAPYRADEYNEWVNVGMMLRELGDAGLMEWDRWSAQSAKFKPGVCAQKWQTFNGNGAGLTLASLFYLAEQDDPRPHHAAPALDDEYDAAFFENANDAAFLARDGTLYDVAPNGTMTPRENKAASVAPEMPFDLVRVVDLGAYTAPAWIVQDIFQCPSLNVFYGESGGGKTWALLELAFQVSRGEKWLQHTTNSAPVLIVDTESGKRRIKNRIRAIERGAGNAFGQDTFVITDRAINLNLAALGQAGKQAQQHKDLLKAAIESCGANFVIVDAFADIAQGADENAAQGVMPTLTALREISNDCNCAIVCIHHSNRNHSSRGGNYRGSSAIKGAIDCMMEMQTVPDPTGYVAKLETTKQRDGKPVTLYARVAFKEFVDDADPFQVVPAFVVKAASESDFDTDARAILDALGMGDKSISQIQVELEAAGVEIKRPTLKYKLARLVKAKAIVRDGDLKNARYHRAAER